MKKIAYILLGLVFISTASCQEVSEVKVQVVEEDGVTPVRAAEVEVIYLGYSGESTQRKKGLTDSEGIYQTTGAAQLRISIIIKKEGYYMVDIDRLNRKENHDVKYILRKIKNPIPLYMRKMLLGIPRNREWLAFDFEVGDWVAPHGNGKKADVLFRCDTTKTAEMMGRGTLEIKFGENEGLKLVSSEYLTSSDMKMPHMAPDSGYEAHFSRSEDSYHNKNVQAGVGYFFRTRLEESDGNVIAANYGKLASDIRFDPRESGWHVSHKNKPKKYATVSFTYYFNPTPNDRNLEFDPKQNLFKDLDVTEMVREP
ncbi:MAG: hypothetical protein AAF571_10875 [Verrucomicrobiota bacterium]